MKANITGATQYEQLTEYYNYLQCTQEHHRKMDTGKKKNGEGQ